MTTLSNITKLEAYFGVRRVTPRARISNCTVYIPNLANISRNIAFSCGTVQAYLLNQKRISVLPDVANKRLIFYPNDEGEFAISDVSSGLTKTMAYTAVSHYIPKIVSGRYNAEPMIVGGIRCFYIEYKEMQ